MSSGILWLVVDPTNIKGPERFSPPKTQPTHRSQQVVFFLAHLSKNQLLNASISYMAQGSKDVRVFFRKQWEVQKTLQVATLFLVGHSFKIPTQGT